MVCSTEVLRVRSWGLAYVFLTLWMNLVGMHCKRKELIFHVMQISGIAVGGEANTVHEGISMPNNP